VKCLAVRQGLVPRGETSSDQFLEECETVSQSPFVSQFRFETGLRRFMCDKVTYLCMDINFTDSFDISFIHFIDYGGTGDSIVLFRKHGSLTVPYINVKYPDCKYTVNIPSSSDTEQTDLKNDDNPEIDPKELRDNLLQAVLNTVQNEEQQEEDTRVEQPEDITTTGHDSELPYFEPFEDKQNWFAGLIWLNAKHWCCVHNRWKAPVLWDIKNAYRYVNPKNTLSKLHVAFTETFFNVDHNNNIRVGSFDSNCNLAKLMPSCLLKTMATDTVLQLQREIASHIYHALLAEQIDIINQEDVHNLGENYVVFSVLKGWNVTKQVNNPFSPHMNPHLANRWSLDKLGSIIDKPILVENAIDTCFHKKVLFGVYKKKIRWVTWPDVGVYYGKEGNGEGMKKFEEAAYLAVRMLTATHTLINHDEIGTADKAVIEHVRHILLGAPIICEYDITAGIISCVSIAGGGFTLFDTDPTNANLSSQEAHIILNDLIYYDNVL